MVLPIVCSADGGKEDRRKERDESLSASRTSVQECDGELIEDTERSSSASSRHGAAALN